MLANALVAASSLLELVEPGAGALLKKDLKLIAASERPRIGDSLDLDDATREEFPNAHRWDYVLSVPSAGHIIGLEPHTAKDSEISVVIAKKQLAIDYLQNHLLPNRRLAKWFWVSHGSVSFSRMERARRLLDQKGIAFVGHCLRSLD